MTQFKKFIPIVLLLLMVAKSSFASENDTATTEDAVTVPSNEAPEIIAELIPLDEDPSLNALEKEKSNPEDTKDLETANTFGLGHYGGGHGGGHYSGGHYGHGYRGHHFFGGIKLFGGFGRSYHHQHHHQYSHGHYGYHYPIYYGHYGHHHFYPHFHGHHHG